MCVFTGQPCAYLLDNHVHIYWTAMCIFTGQSCAYLLDSHVHIYWTAMCVFTGQPCAYLLDSHVHIYWTAMCIIINSLQTARKTERTLEYTLCSSQLFYPLNKKLKYTSKFVISLKVYNIYLLKKLQYVFHGKCLVFGFD
jgi:hypothetical protein